MKQTPTLSLFKLLAVLATPIWIGNSGCQDLDFSSPGDGEPAEESPDSSTPGDGEVAEEVAEGDLNCHAANAGGGFVTWPIGRQEGLFTVRFEATLSGTPIDSVFGISDGAQADYTGYACLVRWNSTDGIQARDGGRYVSVSPIGYAPNTTYQVRMVVDVAARRYSVYLGESGGPERLVGANLGFRSEQATASGLDHVGVIVDLASGSNSICVLAVSDDCAPDCLERVCGKDPICNKQDCGVCAEPTPICNSVGRCVARDEPLLFVGDFETGDRSQWNMACIVAEERFQIVTDPVRQGKYAARFIVRPGDACWGSGERTELGRSTPQEKDGEEYYYGWSTMLDPSWPTPGANWTVLTQWHTLYGTSPAFALDLASNGAIFASMSTGLVSGDPPRSTQYAINETISSISPLAKGIWHDFIVHIKWSVSSSDALVEVWHRPQGADEYSPIWSKTGLPTLQYAADGSGAMIKSKQQGCYRNVSDVTQILYHDGFRMGPSFESVLY